MDAHATTGIEDAAAHHDGGGAGLPQFDPSSFPSQIFWLAVAFLILYIVFSSKILPGLSSIIENRRLHVDSDLETAERLRAEAEKAQETYESLLSSARMQSSDMTNSLLQEMKAKTESAISALRQKSERDIDTLETALQKAKAEAMEDMNTIAAEIASEAAAKITGVPADVNNAKTIVMSLNRREAA